MQLPSNITKMIHEESLYRYHLDNRAAFKMGAEFAATEILKEVEKLVEALKEISRDRVVYIDGTVDKNLLTWTAGTARKALSFWRSFIGAEATEDLGQNQVDMDQKEVGGDADEK